MMKRFLGSAAMATALMLTATAASAQEKVKIGVMMTLSGPNAVLGEQARFEELVGKDRYHDDEDAEEYLTWNQKNPVSIRSSLYWARENALFDNFFASAIGPSFPNHLFTIAAQSGGAHDNPRRDGFFSNTFG